MPDYHLLNRILLCLCVTLTAGLLKTLIINVANVIVMHGGTEQILTCLPLIYFTVTSQTMKWLFPWTSKLVPFFLPSAEIYRLRCHAELLKLKSKTHCAVFNCYIPSWILKLRGILCFEMTRWVVKADIFLLSPQRTHSTWQRSRISKNRLLLSSISVLHPSIWWAERKRERERFETNTLVYFYTRCDH